MKDTTNLVSIFQQIEAHLLELPGTYRDPHLDIAV